MARNGECIAVSTRKFAAKTAASRDAATPRPLVLVQSAQSVTSMTPGAAASYCFFTQAPSIFT
jgi:hypothetical protein